MSLSVRICTRLHRQRTQVMAALRNLVISLLRFAGHTNIARALRHHARHPHRAIGLVTSATRQRNDPAMGAARDHPLMSYPYGRWR